MPHPTPIPDAPVLGEIAAGLGLSLTQAARRLPSSRQGRPVHNSCIWRWIHDGVRLPSGEVVRLEAARLAGRWLTSGPALERFLARQTPVMDTAPTAAPRTPTQRRRASKRAERELERLHI
jgi:hypothetical protein